MSGLSLQGMTVLVTRPEHQAEPLCKMIEEADGRALRFPVIAIEELPLSPATIAAMQEGADYLVFISANAVRLGLQALQEHAPQLLGTTELVAIGEATARAMTGSGYIPHIVPPSPYNSEALLGMHEMQDVAGKCFILVKGRGGRDYLKEQLRHRRAEVIEADVYERVKPASDASVLDEFMQSQSPVVAITSIKGLHYLLEMAGHHQREWLLEEARYLVPGHRIEEALRDVHVRQPPWLADNATDNAMFEALRRHVRQ